MFLFLVCSSPLEVPAVLNWEDAKINQSFGQVVDVLVERKVGEMFADFKSYLDDKFVKSDEKFDKIDDKLDKINDKFKKINKFTKMDEKFDKIDAKLTQMDVKLDYLDR